MQGGRTEKRCKEGRSVSRRHLWTQISAPIFTPDLPEPVHDRTRSCEGVPLAVKPGSDHWVKKGQFVGMVRIEEGLSGGGVFRGRRSSKDMRDGADTRDREKPRTVANMRERDRTLRWGIILFISVHLVIFL